MQRDFLCISERKEKENKKQDRGYHSGNYLHGAHPFSEFNGRLARTSRQDNTFPSAKKHPEQQPNLMPDVNIATASKLYVKKNGIQRCRLIY